MAFRQFLKGPRASLQRLQERFRNSPRHEFLFHWWFPQVPLAVLVGLLGLFRVAPALFQALGWPGFLQSIVDTERQASLTSIHGLPDAVTGVFLIFMSIGLLLRSKLAWFITVLFLLACLVIDIIDYQPHTTLKLIVLDVFVLSALFVWRNRFHKSSLAAATLFSIVSVFSLVGYAIIGTYELGEHFSPQVDDIITALYFSMVTMSTVGYGDITPQTPESRLFVVSLIVLGITVFATSLSAILVPMMNKRMKRMMERKVSHMERREHFVIVGDSALSKNTYRQLKARKESVSVILPSDPEGSLFEPGDIIIGSGSDLDVLNQAGAKRAKAVLALGENDSDNAFVVLAVKEMDTKATTVIGVSHSDNLPRVRRVRPDVVISPQVLGAEILIQALTGEQVDSEMIMARLFRQ